MQWWARTIAHAAIALLIALLLVETFFFMAVSRPDIGTVSLSSRRWFFSHWNPINEYGYRDESISEERLAGKRLAIVVGDSFAAGHGLENYQERFSGVLQTQLGKDWVVVTVAQPGWDLSAGLTALQSLDLNPEYIILSTYTNDLEGIAADLGKDYQGLDAMAPSPLFSWFLERSYAASFVYWYVIVANFIQDEDGSYASYLKDLHTDEVVWAQFRAQLASFEEYSLKLHAKLIVVSFPMLYDPASSAILDNRIRQYLLERKVPLVDVEEISAAIPPMDRILNRMDSHPSRRVHRLVGMAIAEQVLSEYNEAK